MNNTEILNAVAQAVNDAKFTKRTQAIMLGILTDSQNYIVEVTECLRKVDSSLAMVADQPTYDLPATFIKMPTTDTSIKRGLVSLGTYGKYPLTRITQALLNNQYPGWRQTASGTPEFYDLTEEGAPKLRLYPAPSASFISTNGSPILLDMVYRPADIVADTNLPFDNASRFKGVFQILLKLRAIWQIKTEDMQFVDADHYERLESRVDGLMDRAIDFVQSYASAPGQHGFEEQVL